MGSKSAAMESSTLHHKGYFEGCLRYPCTWVSCTRYKVQKLIDFMLGGDWKFLACVCGLDSASSKYSCIWCICSKDKHHIDNKWSITDREEGARTVEDMKVAAKLPKK